MEDTLLNQIWGDVKSIRAELHSMAATFTSNTADIQQRVTSLERDLHGHAEKDDILHANLNKQASDLLGKIDELAFETGKELGELGARIKKIEDVYQEVGGATKAWKIVISLAGALLVIFNLYHLIAPHIK